MSSNTNQFKEEFKFKRFFQHLSRSDKILISIGSVAALVTGALVPIISILMGELADVFDPFKSVQDKKRLVKEISGYIALIAFVIWLTGYIYYSFWQHIGENIAFDLRVRYLNQILKQEVDYFEKLDIEQLPSQIGENFLVVQQSIGQKFASILFAISNLLSAIGVAFYRGPDLAAIYFSMFPLVFLLVKVLGSQVKKVTLQKTEISKKLRGKIEESLIGIKVISTFAQEDREIMEFEELAEENRKLCVKSEYWTASFVAALKFAIFALYAFNYWIAFVFIENKRKNPKTGKLFTAGEMISIMLAILNCTAITFQLIPNFQALVKAKLVGKEIFDVIDRVSAIVDHDQSLSDFNLKSAIKFQNITFKYHKAQQETFKNTSFQIKAETSTAIVGESGSGKSTIIQLIERFYDPLAGDIYFDETNLKNISLKALRESIGYVQQEPVLIIGSIRDNILLGNKDASDDEIDRVIKMANASFIYNLENQLDTHIGSSTLLNLSGGQKQRIAIARALIKNPKILILDEATSALDSKSEREVQEALNNIQNSEKKLTTIMIAHRLQTIQTAENLIYFNKNKSNILTGSIGTKDYEQILNLLSQSEGSKGLEDVEISGKYDSIERQSWEDLSSSKLLKLATDRDLEEDFNSSQAEIIFNPNAEFKSSKKGPEMMKQVLDHYGPRRLIIFSLISSMINAFAFPLNGLIFVKNLFVLLNPHSKTFYEDRNFWCSAYLGLAVGIGLFDFLSKGTQKALSENLTYAVRTKLYSAIVRKELSWFDNKERAPGILINYLSEEVTALNGLTTETFSNILEAVCCLVIGSAIAFFYTWKIALISLATSPLVMLGGVALQLSIWDRAKNSNNHSMKDEKGMDPYDKANALLSEVILNYKTVISFGPKNITYLMQKYHKLLEEPIMINKKVAHFSGIMSGYSQCVRFMFLALMFYVGNFFIYDQNDDPEGTFIGIYTLLMSALSAGGALSQIPSISKAKSAATKIFTIINEEKSLPSLDFDKQTQITQGSIEFNNVEFKYPSRNQKILRRISFKIPAGQKVAIVGHSGSGKSTITNLLLRMYDYQNGQILIDGEDIRTFNQKALRRQIGYVMQEPMLFNMSIKDNIIYGNQQASDDKIREVAIMANALQFIEANDNQSAVSMPIQTQLTKEESIRFNKTFVNQQFTQRDFQLQRVLGSIEQASLATDESTLANQVLSKADDQLLDKISQDTAKLIECVKFCNNWHAHNSWIDVIRKFEWTLESEKIVSYLNEKEDIGQADKDEVILALGLENQANKFDLQKVKEFLQRSGRKNQTFLDYLKCKIEPKQQMTETIACLAPIDLESQPKNKIHPEINQSTYLHPGFNKICGLKGSMLSGGQKQRIAIARALIKDPKVLILDEATSALDEQSQEQVQIALDKAMEGRTSIVIAHRLSTIRNCDWILFLDKGRVVEQGTYLQLSQNKDSHFHKLKSGMQN
ncbi:abc transporter [Stylonychia lemnae]|uniref:Abc transporter n=1 Tax=Stylonychia lemnae TaxID=5949 RepID=A0A077ZMN6_STYLE|nr:abc transporter [Stylonychia lemnae]|eukprot:CDW71198.1 abc transporter [Stylonychia lemnae]